MRTKPEDGPSQQPRHRLYGDLTGVVRLSTTDSTGYLAYILREDTSGHGYATTAVRLLPADTRIPLVTAEHRVGNPASGRVLVKADFVRICVTADLVRYEIAPRSRLLPRSGKTVARAEPGRVASQRGGAGPSPVTGRTSPHVNTGRHLILRPDFCICPGQRPDGGECSGGSACGGRFWAGRPTNGCPRRM
ncbi:GNAT family N-acetyltransferase [Streptomyces hirsutus]|uniref:GNAT family N-acetyltransferase n=1 Tax=Streptomyces hirsutus TaxID=35620 RepID=UPI0036A22C38